MDSFAITSRLPALALLTTPVRAALFLVHVTTPAAPRK